VFEVSRISTQGPNALDALTLRPESLDRFASVLDIADYDALLQTAADARAMLAGRTVWNVTSTARGGGIAEMLVSLLPLALGAGVDARWLVVKAEEEFFRITKRIHNRLHGDWGDRGELGRKEREAYERILGAHADGIRRLAAPGDIVILHDPQTAGLAPAVRDRCSKVIWRSHVGVDVPNELVRSAWRFLLPYLEAADGYVFTRREYVFEGLPATRVAIIPPSIDAFSPKNQSMTPGQVAGILATADLVEGHGDDVRFTRLDGSIGAVTRQADLVGGAPVPEGVPIVTQISRWDRLKDPLGLVRGFADHVAPYSEAHLVVAGPWVAAVSDDPEGAEALSEVRELWSALRPDLRARVHLACLPMEDAEENAAIVNALQRRASVVVQKSLAEGFGLTIAEAMWKERPIVASRVGGIQDQIVDGESGLLVEPTDLAAFGRAVVTLLADIPYGATLARAAHRRCLREYLAPKHLSRYVQLFHALLTRKAA
jgi:trehalose synthase